MGRYIIASLVLRHRNHPTKIREEIKEVEIFYIKNDILIIDDDNSSRCNICNIVVHRTSYAKHLGCKKHLESEKQFKMIIPEWFFQDFIESKLEKNI